MSNGASYFHGRFAILGAHAPESPSCCSYSCVSTSRSSMKANMCNVDKHECAIRQRNALRSSFLFRKYRRGRLDLEHKSFKLGFRTPQNSLNDIPDPVDIEPAMRHLAEQVASLSSQWTHGIVNAEMFSPLMNFVVEKAGLVGNSSAILAEKIVNFPGLLTAESKQILQAQVLEVVKNISADIWAKVNSLSGSANFDHLSHSAAAALHWIETLSQSFGSRAIDFLSESLDASSLSESAEKLAASAGQTMAQLGTAIGISFGSASTEIVPANSNTVLATFAGSAVAGSAVALASSKSGSIKAGFVEGKDLPLRYDPDAIAVYFKQRPMDIISRSLKIIYECSAFTASLLLDKSAGLAKDNERKRAAQLLVLIEKLGPTAIKIGQALSIRPDILPAAYLEELQKLQDRVPPFPNEEAKQLILEGLGKPVEDVFSEMSVEPIAAASLGQVYKARLRDTGELVAVKVQRPGILEGICRDLYLLRSGAHAAQSLPNLHSNLVAFLDNWAYRFFDELDYVQEAKNATRFRENMKSLPNIIVPQSYMKYTSRKVLTSSWVEGEKLSESKAGDSLQLVKTALNCYLVQLLESGFLHADPHPGNLLRTPNGCLCVLDFGLMTEVTQDQRYAFMEYIAHLSNSDYARVAEDLVKLGFVPPELVDPEKTAAAVPQLSHVLGQLVQGGGARKVNIQEVIDELSKMAEEYVFVIPPYFALILRAFSVLEGIGLEADPDYTIVEECFPYLSKRLITDDSPRTRATLKYFLYAGKEQLDVTRVEEIISGFQTFQDLTTIPTTFSSLKKLPSPVDPAAKEVLYLLFAPDGSYIQELLLTELVRAIDALSRDAVAELWRYFASRVFIPLPPPLSAPKSWPVLPGLIFGSSPVATLSEEDEQSLETVRRLWVLVVPQLTQRDFATEVVEAAYSIMPLIPDLFPGIVTATQRFLLMLIRRQALRLADDLDGKKSVADWDKDPAALARQIKPISFLPFPRPSELEPF